MIAAVLTLALAATPAPPPLAPVGPWLVEAEDNLCLLSRSYGPAESRVVVAMQPMFNAKTMEVILITPDASKDQRVGEATMGTAAAAKPFKGSFVSVPSKDGKRRITRVSIESTVWDALSDGAEMTIKAKPLATTIRIVRPAAALAAFAKCQNELLTSWGVDPATMADKERGPDGGNLARYFGPDAYPAEAQRAGVSGRVVVLLQIDATGAVTACRVVASAGPTLNEGTCAAARRARFKPARDRTNKPVPSVSVLPVRWVLGGDWEP